MAKSKKQKRKTRNPSTPVQQPMIIAEPQNRASSFGNALAAGFGLGVGEAAGEDLFDSLFGGKRRSRRWKSKKKFARRSRKNR